jgi:hypothetical protein
MKTCFAVLLLAMAATAGAQIKPGEWNGTKPGASFPSLSITLFESGEASLGYNTTEVEIMARGTWKRIKEGKFAGDALVDLEIEYIKRGEKVSYEGSIDPIYLGQSGNEAFVIKGVSAEEIEIDISFPLRHTGHRHIKITEGNH